MIKVRPALNIGIYNGNNGAGHWSVQYQQLCGHYIGLLWWKEPSQKAKLLIHLISLHSYGHKLWVVTKRLISGSKKLLCIMFWVSVLGFLHDASLGGGAAGLSNQEEIPGQTEDMLERLYLSLGLWVPWYSSGGAGESDRGERVHFCLVCRPCNLDKQWMVDGWMIWLHLRYKYNEISKVNKIKKRFICKLITLWYFFLLQRFNCSSGQNQRAISEGILGQL